METRPAFPYAPKVVRDYLRERVAAEIAGNDWVVSTKVPPNNKPAKLVTIGTVPAHSPGDNLVLSTRRLIIHCWNSNELYCGRMAERVRSWLVSAPRNGATWIRGVAIVGEPADFRDPDNESLPRFQITVDVLMRAYTDANPEPEFAGPGS